MGALATLVVATALPAAAFVQSQGAEGVCLSWDKRQLSWVMASGDPPELPVADAMAAYERSFQTWEDVECSDVSFIARGDNGERSVGFSERGSNENVLLFREQSCDVVVPASDECWDNEDCANRWDCWEHPKAAIAVTTTTFTLDGQIVDADIEFNAASFRFTALDGAICRSNQTENCVSTDLQNTATHEIGHFIGLDHSPIESATMYASAPLGETSKRVLTTDDIDGICAIYPAGEKSALECIVSRERSSEGCGCSSASGFGLEALLALGPLLWCRRRPR